MFRRRRRSIRSAMWSQSFRVKHRGAWLAMLVSAVIFGSSGLAIAGMTMLAGRDAALVLTAAENSESDALILGSGINLRGAGDANLIENPSFEPFLRSNSMTVTAAYDGEDGRGVWIPMVEDGPNQSDVETYASSRYRLLRQSETGLMQTVNQGSISACRELLPLQEQVSRIPVEGDQVASMTHAMYVSEAGSDRRMVAVGEGGMILWYDGRQFVPYTLRVDTADLLPGYLVTSYQAEALIDIERYGDAYYVLSANGMIFRTGIDDPAGWTLIEAMDPYMKDKMLQDEWQKQDWVDLFMVGDVLFAMNRSGYFWQIKDGRLGEFHLRDYIQDPLMSYIDESKFSLDGVIVSLISVQSADMMGETLVLATSSSVILLQLEKTDDGFYRISDGQASLPSEPRDWNSQQYWQDIMVLDDQTALARDFMFNIMIIREADEATSESAERFQMDYVSTAETLEISLDYYPVAMVPINEESWYYIFGDGDVLLYTLEKGRKHQAFPKAITSEYGMVASFLLPGEGIVMVDYAKQFYVLPLGTALLFDDDDPVGTAAPASGGDILILETREPERAVDALKKDWHYEADVTWKDHVADQTGATAKSGDKFVSLDHGAVVAQTISDAGADFSRAQDLGIYNLKFLAMEEGVGGELTVRIEGPFEPLELHFSKFGRSWQLYSENIIIPRRTGKVEEPVVLSFAWTGDSRLKLDDVFLAETIRSDNIYATKVIEDLTAAAPSLLRFTDAAVGRPGVSNEAWLDYQDIDLYPVADRTDGVSSLEAALRLARSAKADPWLVLDSFARHEDAKAIIGYLAAPPGDVYGDKRLANGTAVSWTAQFTRIVVEVTDSAGIYRTDSEKAAFVDMLFDGLTSSPHYQAVKHQIVLVDKMNYSEGFMLSKADYHSAALAISADAGRSYQDSVGEAYQGFAASSPRMQNAPARAVTSLINDFSLVGYEASGADAVSSAAEILSILEAFDYACAAVMLPVDYNGADPALNDKNLLFASLLRDVYGGRRIRMTINEPDAGVPPTLVNNGSEEAELPVYSFAFNKDGRKIVYVLNLGMDAESFKVKLKPEADDAAIFVYDKAGELQIKEKYQGGHKRVFLPGGALAIIFEGVQTD